MIVQKLYVRQSRQLLALSRRAPISGRFLSTETPVDTALRTPSARPIDPIQKSEEVKEGVTPKSQWAKWQQSSRHSHRTTPGEKNKTNKFLFHRFSEDKFQSTGTQMQEIYDPKDLITNPIKPSEITLELLLASGTHMGHSTSRWNPQNSRYIFGIREGVHIISLDVTASHLRRAAKVVEEVAARGGIILFAGTRKGQKQAVVRAAELAKGYHIFERWIPGSLTNGQQILGHCETKVVNALDEELPEFKMDLADRPTLKPDLVVCLNPLENVVLLHECGLNNVPTIGVIDTDADPTRVTYPIPANDDSLRAISLISGVLGRAGEAGQERRLAMAKQGKTTYAPITEKELRLDPLTGLVPGAEQGQQK
ncbi:Ribosomal protein S2 bacteria/mitochondria/plastid [Penicillium taxi]|uniref:Ribosomal protein S2 bacteria/mitochondria/plastid n=1 Tax=Penicillium taxi TaxID=168475 RepID=UPI002545A774|nr:Ribosomal protein S2 bacteria/mitochondria/plastid [Penicillium taxi]KAJ5908981.1 Ribosomal protein S2 bacteria/mitochondria/plastid [Penicillium taxi]